MCQSSRVWKLLWKNPIFLLLTWIKAVCLYLLQISLFSSDNMELLWFTSKYEKIILFYWSRLGRNYTFCAFLWGYFGWDITLFYILYRMLMHATCITYSAFRLQTWVKYFSAFLSLSGVLEPIKYSQNMALMVGLFAPCKINQALKSVSIQNNNIQWEQ